MISATSAVHLNGFQLTGIRRKRDDKRDDKVETHTDFGELSLFEATKVYACVTDICQKIKEFSIPKIQENNCHDEFLPIVWDYKDNSNNSKSKVVSGFLSPDGSVFPEQKKSNKCKIVKRYYIFKKCGLI